MIGLEPLPHQVLLVISVALPLATLGRTACIQSPIPVRIRLLVAWLVLRRDLETLRVDLFVGQTVTTVILLLLESDFELVDLACAALIFGTVVLDELVEAGVAWGHLKATRAAVRCASIGLHHSSLVVFDGSHLTTYRRFALSLGPVIVPQRLAASHGFLSRATL